MGNPISKKKHEKSEKEVDNKEQLINEILNNANLVVTPKQITYLKLKLKDAEWYFYTNFDCFLYYNSDIFSENINSINDTFTEKVGKCIHNKYYKTLIEFDSLIFEDSDDEDPPEFESLFMIILEKFEINMIHYFDLSILKQSDIYCFLSQLINSVESNRSNRKFDAMYFILPNVDYICKIDLGVVYISQYESEFVQFIKSLEERYKEKIEKIKSLKDKSNEKFEKMSSLKDIKEVTKQAQPQQSRNFIQNETYNHTSLETTGAVTKVYPHTANNINLKEQKKSNKELFVGKEIVGKGQSRKNISNKNLQKLNKEDSLQPEFNVKDTKNIIYELLGTEENLKELTKVFTLYMKNPIEISTAYTSAVFSESLNFDLFLDCKYNNHNIIENFKTFLSKTSPNSIKLISHFKFSVHNTSEFLKKNSHELDILSYVIKMVPHISLLFNSNTITYDHIQYYMDLLKYIVHATVQVNTDHIKLNTINIKFCINKKKVKDYQKIFEGIKKMIKMFKDSLIEQEGFNLKAVRFFCFEVILYERKVIEIKEDKDKQKTIQAEQVKVVIEDKKRYNIKNKKIKEDIQTKEVIIEKKNIVEEIDLLYERVVYMVRNRNNNLRRILLKKFNNKTIVNRVLELSGEVISFAYRYYNATEKMSYDEFQKLCS